MVLKFRAIFATLAMLFPAFASFGNSAGTKPPKTVATVTQWAIHQGNFIVHNFRFRDGETLPELRLHYTSLGQPRRNAQGQVTNAVLILHGTGGSGQQFLQSIFAGVLFGKGQLLDASTHYIILPDDIGHGGSSKPSDGLRMKFPHYDYADMVQGEYDLVTQGLHVNHLRLVMGTSMGCMHTWMWGEAYPHFMDAMMPLACYPVPIVGRNRIDRDAIMDLIRDDPAWNGGNYKTEPVEGLRGALAVELMMVSAPLYWQRVYDTPQKAAAFLRNFWNNALKRVDADDFLYAWDSSRDYNPEPDLSKIAAWVLALNTSDDFVNPPELRAELHIHRLIHRIPHGRFVLLPITSATRGHTTHTHAAVWKNYLAQLLAESRHVKSHAE